MDDAQVADIKKLILDVVTALQGINEEAFSAYLYAREIDLALQKVAEIAPQFGDCSSVLSGSWRDTRK